MGKLKMDRLIGEWKSVANDLLSPTENATLHLVVNKNQTLDLFESNTQVERQKCASGTLEMKEEGAHFSMKFDENSGLETVTCLAPWVMDGENLYIDLKTFPGRLFYKLN